MRTKFYYTIFIFLFIADVASAQFIQAYQDFRKYLYVFQDGVSYQLESQPVRSFAVSAEAVVYVDNANNLKGWYRNEKFDLGEGNDLQLTSSRKYITFQRGQFLGLFDNGKYKRLASFLKEYTVGDEIIAFKEDNYDMLKAYYNGEIIDLEYTLVSKLGSYQVGDNVVAFSNGSHYFKVFHNGELLELEQWEPTQFVCGRDMVAYIDGSTQNLKLFYNDKVLKLENFPPTSMQMGDNVFAYVSDESAFKVYSNGKLLKIESYAPDFFKVQDNICAFFFDNKLQIVLDGTRYELENFNPRSYQISNNNIAWVDNSGRLKMFDKGKTITVTSEIVGNYSLNGDVLKYEGGDGLSHIFYRGKTF